MRACVHAGLPGIAGVIMRGVKLLQLLPCQVRDGQRLSAGHHRVGVVWIQFVLEVLGIQSLIVGLQKSFKTVRKIKSELKTLNTNLGKVKLQHKFLLNFASDLQYENQLFSGDIKKCGVTAYERPHNEKLVTYKSSFHFVKHHSFKNERAVGIRRVFIFQPPAFLPEQIKKQNKTIMQ